MSHLIHVVDSIERESKTHLRRQRLTLFRWLQIVGFKAIGITLGLALIAGWVMEGYW